MSTPNCVTAKPKLYLVHPAPPKSLPPEQLPSLIGMPALMAVTLILIQAGRENGVSSLELFERGGLISVHKHVAHLRKRGAIIHTQRKTVRNWKGSDRRGIAFYIYKGWR